MLSEVIGLAKASWQSLNMEVGKNLSERQKRRIRHDVARRLVERRLAQEETCISTSEGPGERSDRDGGDDGDEMVLEMLQIVSVWTVIPRRKI